MDNGLITCRSQTAAQKLAGLTRRAGCPAAVTQIPQKLAATGCGYCVRMPEYCLGRVYRLMQENGFTEGRVFRRTGSGYEAVIL